MTSPASDTRASRLSGIARIALAGLIWGSMPLFLRSADGASVIKVFFRVGGAAVVIGVWLAVSGRWRELTTLPARKWWQLASQGLVLTANWLLFLTALDMTSVATAELMAYSAPVLVAVLAPAVTGERFDRRVVLPLALSLGGIVVILAPQGLSLGSGRQLLGAGLALASAATYATLLLRSKKILAGVTSGALMIVEYTLATLVLSPFVIWQYAHGNGPSTPVAYASLITVGIVHTAIAGFIFLGGMRRVRTDRVAVLTYVEPVSAIFFAAIFLAEPLSLPTVVGALMVVTGGVIVARIDTDAGVMPVPIEAPSAEPAIDSVCEEPDAWAYSDETTSGEEL
ncbi:MAG TPA: DMT family transporter [Coriobacteriia bacterium]|nr:DMT family transporter [Coriobacteriia bacterium]